jgi:hypothetical protein
VSEHRYRISYDVVAEMKPEGYSKDELWATGRGGTDAFFFLSMLSPADGSFSLAVASRDGFTGEEATDDELFKCWTLIAHRLAESTELSPGKRAFAEAVFAEVRRVVAGRGQEAHVEPGDLSDYVEPGKKPEPS